MRLFIASLMCLLAACPIATPDAEEPSEPPPPGPAPAPQPSSSTLVRANDFDQFCTHDTDCTAVFEGNACDPVRRANAAIRLDAMPEYRVAIGAYWACYEPTPFDGPQIGDSATCIENRCSL